MRAILLSASRPTHFQGPISTLSLGKCTLLEAQIADLRAVGISDITVVTGFKSEQVSDPRVKCVQNARWEETGSVGSLALAMAGLSDNADTLVAYGDTLFSAGALRTLMHSQPAIAALCLLDRSNRDYQLYREFASIEGDQLVAVRGKHEGTGVRTAFTGLLLARGSKLPALRDALHDQRLVAKAHLGALVDVMLHRGVEISPVLIEEGWRELATQDDVMEALADISLQGALPVVTDWRERAKGYDCLDWVNNDQLLSRMIDVIGRLRPANALDVGTGTGKILMAMRDHIGIKELWGVDSSDEMIGKVPKKYGFELRIEDAEQLTAIPKDHFDVVTARMVYHHLRDTVGAARQAFRVLRPGGHLVVCEGVPPSLRSVDWYTEMFRFKEERNTLTEVDLIQMFVSAGFERVGLEVIVLRNCSLNNWLDNSGIPPSNIDKIKLMHYEAPEAIRNDYEMRFEKGDCLMTWRFAVTYGERPSKPSLD